MKIACKFQYDPGTSGLPTYYLRGAPVKYQYTLMLTSENHSEERVLKKFGGTLVNLNADRHNFLKYFPFNDTPEDAKEYEDFVSFLMEHISDDKLSDLPKTFDEFKTQAQPPQTEAPTLG